MPKIVAQDIIGAKHVLGVYQPKEVEYVLNLIFECKENSFEMPISNWYSNGRLLNDYEVEKIRGSLQITSHSIKRMIERGLFVNKPTKEEVAPLITNNVCAYYDNDGTIICAVDATHYFVLERNFGKNKYILLTYAEESVNGYTVFDKRKLAQTQCKNWR